MPRAYVPDRGDIVWLQFNPQAGHRPALVVSPRSYNGKVGLALFCPLTSRVKGYPFEVRLPPDLEVSGAVLADQIKSLDWRIRKAKRITTVPEEVMDDILAKILALLGEA